DLRQRVGNVESRWIQLQGVPVERRVPLGVRTGFVPLSRLERRTTGIQSHGGLELLSGRRNGSSEPAPVQHVPHQGVVLVQSLRRSGELRGGGTLITRIILIKR